MRPKEELGSVLHQLGWHSPLSGSGCQPACQLVSAPQGWLWAASLDNQAFAQACAFHSGKALLGHGVAVVEQIDGKEAVVLLGNKRSLHIARKDIVLNQQNMRWEYGDLTSCGSAGL